VLGVVTLVEKGDLLFELRRGRWVVIGRLLASLPPGAGPWALRLARLERLRRPFFPPLFMGTPDELLGQLVRTYEAEGLLLMREEGLASEERALLGRSLRPGMRLLDIGCGPGREAIGFAHEGLAVTAVDLVPAMVQLARARARAAGVPVTFEVADPLTFDAAPESFDAVYLSPGVYAHIPGRARRIETLQRLGRLLAPEGFVVLGLVLFDPFPLVSRARLVDLLRRLGRWCGVRRVSEPGDHYHRGYGLARAPGSFRYLRRFTGPDEMIVEVREAGFEISGRLEDSPTWIIRPRA
jgi:SAM-dependent methyltransferase